MAFIAFADIYYVELVYNVFQQTCQNTLYFLNDGNNTQARLDLLNATTAAWWETYIGPLVADSVTLTEITVRDISQQFGFYSAQSYAVQGDLTSPALPLNVTVAIKFNSGLVGRRTRGRNFIVGLCESQVTGNELISTVGDDFIAAYEELQDQHVTEGFSHMIASRAAPTGSNPPFGQTYAVASYSMDMFIDSQRRRLSGRGS